MKIKKTTIVVSNKENAIAHYIKHIILHFALFTVWWFVYSHLQVFFAFSTYSLLHVATASRLDRTLEFFFYDTPKVFMLLGLVIYIVGSLRSFITPEKTRRFLAGKS